MSELTALKPVPAEGSLATLSRQAREFAAAAKADNTLRAYQADWKDFREWCEAHRLQPLPAAPETVALYLTDRASNLKASSLARRLTTINRAHQAAGQPSPATMQNAVVSEVWKGIKRRKGTSQHGKEAFPDFRSPAHHSGASAGSSGGCAIGHCCWLALPGGFRRSELAALRVEDLETTPDGLIVRLGKSKTDQEGQGRNGGPAIRVRSANLSGAHAGCLAGPGGHHPGPVFRAIGRGGAVSDRALHADSVGYLVKRAAARAGLESAEYAGHSLRAGLATQAATNGASEYAIMKQTGHRSLATVRRYIREGSLFRDNAAAKLGL